MAPAWLAWAHLPLRPGTPAGAYARPDVQYGNPEAPVPAER